MAKTTFEQGSFQAVRREIDVRAPIEYFRGMIAVLGSLPTSTVEQAVDQLFRGYRNAATVYLFGNGGSAALASHAACDLGKGMTILPARPFRILSLTDNLALITAWANDTGYENIFAAQLRTLAQPGDIAFAISGSGNSPNVLNGLEVARSMGATTIGLTGFNGGAMAELCDTCIVAPSENMQHIEDSHLCIMHAIFLALHSRISAESLQHSSAASV